MGFMIISGPSFRPPALAAAWFTGLLALGGLGACTNEVGAADDFNADACTPGEVRCVCRPDQSCEGDLVCVRDICLPDEESAPVPDPTPEDSQNSESPKSSQPGSKKPEPKKPDPKDPEPEKSESGENEEDDPAEEESPQDPESEEQAACSDNKRNFRETDLDCGGPICTGCELSQSCRGGVDCLSGVCENMVCVSCSKDAHCEDNNPCTSNQCQASECVFEAMAEGETCDDEDPCTSRDRCQAGSCVGKSTLMIAENFDDGGEGWRLVHPQGKRHVLWEVGEARASDCGPDSIGQDPAQDHTQNGANAVAGVQIGGCQSRRGTWKWDCIWSKDVDVSHFEEPVVFSFWRHLHSPAHSGKRGVENRVVYRVNRGKTSKLVESGYPELSNDPDWVFRSYEIKAKGARSIAAGVCYRKGPGTGAFASWTIDDVSLRQRGCQPNR